MRRRSSWIVSGYDGRDSGLPRGSLLATLRTVKETLALVFRYLHLLGFAGLFGGLLVQIAAKTRNVSHSVLDGALLQLVTGLVDAVERFTGGCDQGDDRTMLALRVR